MSYKRVVKKKGKSYGPYIYESYRDNEGKVRKRYLGKVEEEKKMSLSIVGVLAILFLLGVGYTTDFYLNEGSAFGRFTGLVVDEPEDSSNDEVAEKVEEEVPVEVVDVHIEEADIDVEETDDRPSGSVDSVGDEVIEEILDVVVFEDESIIEEDIVLDKSIAEDANESIVEDANESIVEDANESIVESVNRSIIEEENESIVEEENESIVEDVLAESFLNKTVSVVNESVVNESEVVTLQYRAVIGRPVKWIKRVNTSSGNVSIELPLDAENISILTDEEVGEALDDIDDYDDLVDEVDREEVVEGGLLTGNVVVDLNEGEGFLVRFWKWVVGFTISGNVILEEDIDIVETENFTVVDVVDVLAYTGVPYEEGNISEIAVEYYTEAPVANESFISGGKRVVVSASSELNYSEILAYVLVEGEIVMGDSRLKVYWYNEEGDNGTRINADCTDYADLSEEVECRLVNGSSASRVEVEYVAYDFDEDGFIDYVEWVVPHLSAQLYDIIYITNAVLLDENRAFVEDVYDFVKAQDGNFTEVEDGEYLRVTFEEELDSSKDITIYARAVCDEFVVINGTEVPCDVYWDKIRIDEIKAGY